MLSFQSSKNLEKDSDLKIKEESKIRKLIRYGLKLDTSNSRRRQVIKRREIYGCEIRGQLYPECQEVFRWNIHSQILKTAKKMQKFHLQSTMYRERRISMIQDLRRSLIHFRDLQEISYDFSHTYINHDLLPKICQDLKRLKNVKKINLKFLSPREMDFDKSLCLILNILKRMRSLRSITLHFKYWNGMTDRALGIIGKSLKRLVSLQKLDINFRYCSQITDLGLLSLSKSFKNFVSLQMISLVLTDEATSSRITNLGMQSLSESLKGLESLKTVKLDVAYLDAISDSALVDLSQFFKSCKYLQNIDLNFSKCHAITDMGLQCICESFKKLTDLQKVNLSFMRCQEITDVGMQSMIEGLERSTQFVNVVLDIYDCKKITSAKVDELTKVLKRLVPSQNFKIITKEKKIKKNR